MTDTPTPTQTEADVAPAEGRFWLEDEMFALDSEGMHVPRFSVQEAAKSFFAEGADWLRWRMRPDKPVVKRCPVCAGTGKDPSNTRRKCPECKGSTTITLPPSHPHGYFVLDGKPLEFKRLKVPATSKKAGDPNAVTARYYTLADIERMSHALYQQGVINADRLTNIVLMVRICADLYGVPGVGVADE